MPYSLSVRKLNGIVVAEWKGPGTELQIVAGESFSPLTAPMTGTQLPAVQQMRGTGLRTASFQTHSSAGLTAQTNAVQTNTVQSYAMLIGLLLPAVQKVREAASLKLWQVSKLSPAGPRNTVSGAVLPYLEQDNLLLRSAKAGSGGALALSPVNPPQAKPAPATPEGHECLVFFLGGTAGSPSVVLENGILQVEPGGAGRVPLLLIGYSSSRVI